MAKIEEKRNKTPLHYTDIRKCKGANYLQISSTLSSPSGGGNSLFV